MPLGQQSQIPTAVPGHPAVPKAPGIRAGAGLLIFAALVFAWFPLQNRLLHRWLPGMGSVEMYVIGHLAQLVEILLFAWAASKLERRSFAAYGLPWRLALRSRFWQGAVAGISSLTVLVLALVALGGLELTMPTRVMAAAAAIAAAYFLLFIVLATREEFLYRGYGLATLGRNIGFWRAAVVSSAWFVSTHAGNSGETPLGLLVVGLFGLFACVLLRRTGNLWLPIGFHTAWNWGQTFLFGVSDSGHAAAPGHFFTAVVPSGAPAWISGGATGPEGSALCVVLVAVLTIGSASLRWQTAPLAAAEAAPGA